MPAGDRSILERQAGLLDPRTEGGVTVGLLDGLGEEPEPLR
jgi:hypothetical protein